MLSRGLRSALGNRPNVGRRRVCSFGQHEPERRTRHEEDSWNDPGPRLDHVGQIQWAPTDVSAGQGPFSLVGDTGFEPVTSSVSRKRATAAPIALDGVVVRGGYGI